MIRKQKRKNSAFVPVHGGAPDSIAGERENKHTADGVPA